jgi:hypothetical protein
MLSDSLVVRPRRQQEGLPKQCRVALLSLKSAYSDWALISPDERGRSTKLLKHRLLRVTSSDERSYSTSGIISEREGRLPQLKDSLCRPLRHMSWKSYFLSRTDTGLLYIAFERNAFHGASKTKLCNLELCLEGTNRGTSNGDESNVEST